MNALEFFIPGFPRPGGSKRFLGMSKKGHAIIADDCVKGKDWRASVAYGAREAMQNDSPTDAALFVQMTFHIIRPKGHFRSGKNSDMLRDSAPKFPTSKPDVLKLARSTEDAMTGIVWKDDSATVTLVLKKRYSETPGVHIYIRKEIK
jgi:Holliday junction resolvase RusA-like endonuclease